MSFPYVTFPHKDSLFCCWHFSLPKSCVKIHLIFGLIHTLVWVFETIFHIKILNQMKFQVNINSYIKNTSAYIDHLHKAHLLVNNWLKKPYFSITKRQKKTIIIHAIALETRASTLTVTSTQIYIFESLIAPFTKSFWYMFLCCFFNNYIVSIPLCYHTLFFLLYWG